MPEVTPEQLEALATGIGDLTTEVQNLNAAYQSKKAEIDAAVQESRDAVTSEAGRIDDFIQGGEENWSFMNLHRNPHLRGTIEDGDIDFQTYNPAGHTVTYDAIQPEDGEAANAIGRLMGGWNKDENGAEIITAAERVTGDYLQAATPKFLRVTIVRNQVPLDPSENSNAHDYFNMGGLLLTRIPGGDMILRTGISTFILGYVAVESGFIKITESGGARYIAAGEVAENVRRVRSVTQRPGAFDANYWDFMKISLEDAEGAQCDEATFVIALPVQTQGICNHFRTVCQPNHESNRLGWVLGEGVAARPWAVI